MDLQPCRQTLDRQIEALVDLRTIRREGIYLTGFVGTTTETFCCPATGVRPHDDHIAVKWSPLALHPVETVSEVEDQIEPCALCHRPIDVDAKLDRSSRDRELRNRALSIRRENLSMLSF